MTNTRTFGAGDFVAALLGGGSIVVMAGTPASAVVLGALVVVLIAWPFVLLASLVRRWVRQGDRRFVAVAMVLIIVAATGVALSRLLTPGT